MRQFPAVDCKLERVSKFESLPKAIQFFLGSHPARQRFRNILEPEQGSNHYFKDFAGQSPDERWSTIAYAIGLVLKDKTHEKYWVWFWRNIAFNDRAKQPHPHDLAKQFGRSRATIYRWLDEVDDELSQLLIKRGILKRQDLPYGH